MPWHNERTKLEKVIKAFNANEKRSGKVSWHIESPRILAKGARKMPSPRQFSVAYATTFWSVHHLRHSQVMLILYDRLPLVPKTLANYC